MNHDGAIGLENDPDVSGRQALTPAARIGAAPDPGRGVRFLQHSPHAHGEWTTRGPGCIGDQVKKGVVWSIDVAHAIRSLNSVTHRTRPSATRRERFAWWWALDRRLLIRDEQHVAAAVM
jgi:hypothetical protein